LRYILLLFLLFVFSSCENDLKKVKMFEKKDKKLPDQVIIDAKMIYSDSAEIVAIIVSPRLEYYNNEKPYQEFPKGVKVDIYEHDSVSSNLKSNYAINFEKERIMEAKSNVIVTNIRGETLNTEHLIWDQNKKKIYSNVFVKITTATQIWMGKGFESDERFDKWELKNPTGNIYIDKNELE
jgi:LPS export ABC transporter protein LptC